MSFRSDQDIQASFQQIAHSLDHALEISQPALTQSGIRLRDWSNRSGFDKSGFPYFTWTYWFEREVTDEVFIGLTTVRLDYTEPLDEGKAVVLEYSWVSEVFQRGAPSIFKQMQTENLPVEAAFQDSLWKLVRNGLLQAEKVLPPQYKFEFTPMAE